MVTRGIMLLGGCPGGNTLALDVRDGFSWPLIILAPPLYERYGGTHATGVTVKARNSDVAADLNADVRVEQAETCVAYAASSGGGAARGSDTP